MIDGPHSPFQGPVGIHRFGFSPAAIVAYLRNCATKKAQLKERAAGPGRRAEKADRHPARSEGPGLAAQDSRKEGIALPVAGQSDPGGGDAEGELERVGKFNKSIVRPDPK